MDVIEMRLSKKHGYIRFACAIACLSLTFSSFPACQAKTQERTRFCLVLDPFTHCLEKVPLHDIFSVIDLHFLASESPLTVSEQNASPEANQDPSLFPWDNANPVTTLEISSEKIGVAVPELAHQTWFDRLMESALKYKN